MGWGVDFGPVADGWFKGRHFGPDLDWTWRLEVLGDDDAVMGPITVTVGGEKDAVAAGGGGNGAAAEDVQAMSERGGSTFVDGEGHRRSLRRGCI